MTQLDAVQFLTHQHEKSMAQFAAIEQASPPMRGELWRRLQPELLAVQSAADAYLYRPLLQNPKATDAGLAGFARRREEIGAKLEQMMREAQALDPAGDAWLAKIMAFRSALADHVADDETPVLRQATKVWPQQRLVAAGVQMEEATLRQSGKVAA